MEPYFEKFKQIVNIAKEIKCSIIEKKNVSFKSESDLFFYVKLEQICDL